MTRTILSVTLLSALLVGSLAAQSTPKKAKGKPRPVPAAQPEVPAAPVAPEPPPAPKPKPRVRIDTSYGPIVVELEAELAPRTVENFLDYVKAGHYTDTIFHRVIKGFMIQGGGHLQDMTEKPSRGPIPNEAARTFKAGLRNVPGTLAMARLTDPHSATAQFYINTAENRSLDHTAETPELMGYCVFGRVVEGMENVQKIEQVRTVWRKGFQDVPEYAVRIKGAEILPEK